MLCYPMSLSHFMDLITHNSHSTALLVKHTVSCPNALG
uniref:Uncharacterized protein n=1 Tax=Anguilla anguilla TaxID=7936 RepID=A0A0E9VG29_ANGAN